MLSAVPAFAVNTDVWTQWTASPQDSWIRSLDFTAASTLVASTEGEGIFQAPATLGPWVQANSGLDAPGDLDAYQVVASGGKLYAATGSGLFTAAQGPSPSWTQLGGGIGANKLNMGGIESVVVESPASLVVAVAGAGDPGVYTSADGGGTWTRASGMPDGENIFDLASSAGGSVLYAAGDGGVWTSVSGGTSWTLTADGINPAETAFRVSAASPTEIWAATTGSVYKSTNGGVSWSSVDGAGDTALPGAGVKKAFLLTPQFGAGRSLVGTDDGVYASVDGGQSWGAMSPDAVGQAGGFLAHGIVWALGVGFTPPALLAGTQGYGVYSLPMTPVSSGGTPAVSPGSGLVPGDSVSVTANWSGTLPFFVTYVWKRCSGANCTTVGQGPSYTIPDADASSSYQYEAQACATNLVAPAQVCVTSAKTSGGVTAVPGSQLVPLSGGTQSSISPDPEVSYPWGTTFTIDPGQWGTESQQNVEATPFTYSYAWQRCDQVPTCTDIQGATGATYTTTAADVGDTIRGFVAAQHFGGADASQFYLAADTFTIIEKTPVNTAPPKILGAAVVGTVLQSTAGAWTAHTPVYTRRWLRCGADGLDCQPLQPDQAGTTDTLTPADLGSTIELEVTATQADPSQNRVTVVDSAPTAVVTQPSSSSPPPPPPPPGQPAITLARPPKLVVGATLRGPSSVSGYTGLKYRWLRNGKPIKGATKATYRIVRRDRGKKLSLALTLTSIATGKAITVLTSAIKVPSAHRKHHHHKHKRHRKR
jgi:hypothetical protein